MRTTRSAKYRRKRKVLLLIAQVLAICYGFIASTSYLTSGTEAYFSSNLTSVDTTITTADYWWDGSDLKILGNGNENIPGCAPIEISIEVENTGFSMTGATEYAVYYIENGNPQNGEIVGNGTLNPINAGEVSELIFEAQENGSYQFKVFQREGYDGNDNPIIWSKKIMVKCNTPNMDVTQEMENDQNIDQVTESEVNDPEEEHSNESNEEDELEEEAESENNTGEDADDSTADSNNGNSNSENAISDQGNENNGGDNESENEIEQDEDKEAEQDELDEQGNQGGE